MRYAAMINKAKIEKYYLFNTILRKIPDIWSFVIGQNVDKKRWDLIATINSHSFFQEIFSYFQICHLLNTVTIFSAQTVLIFKLMLQFVTLFF